jgi:hypothetical protein
VLGLQRVALLHQLAELVLPLGAGGEVKPAVARLRLQRLHEHFRGQGDLGVAPLQTAGAEDGQRLGHAEQHQHERIHEDHGSSFQGCGTMYVGLCGEREKRGRAKVRRFI